MLSHRIHPVDAGAFVVASSGWAIFSAISVYRHDRFASGGFDLGIFDQTIWGYSRFEIVHNTVKGIPNLPGDHSHPAWWCWRPFTGCGTTPEYRCWPSRSSSSLPAFRSSGGVAASSAGWPLYPSG